MVIVYSPKSKQIVCKDAIMCSSIWSKGRGLMVSKRKNLVFLFRKDIKAHLNMVFVFFPIHVIGLDKSKKVTEVGFIKPFRFWSSNKKVRYIIELSKPPYLVPGLGERIDFR